MDVYSDENELLYQIERLIKTNRLKTLVTNRKRTTDTTLITNSKK